MKRFIILSIFAAALGWDALSASVIQAVSDDCIVSQKMAIGLPGPLVSFAVNINDVNFGCNCQCGDTAAVPCSHCVPDCIPHDPYASLKQYVKGGDVHMVFSPTKNPAYTAIYVGPYKGYGAKGKSVAALSAEFDWMLYMGQDIVGSKQEYISKAVVQAKEAAACLQTLITKEDLEPTWCRFIENNVWCESKRGPLTSDLPVVSLGLVAKFKTIESRVNAWAMGTLADAEDTFDRSITDTWALKLTPMK